MNRKQRRATMKLGSPASANSSEFRRTDQAALVRSRFARARAEIRRCRARLQARVGDRRRSCRGLQQSRPGSSGSRQDERCLRLLRPLARAHAATSGTIRGNLRHALFTAPRAGGSAPPPGRRMAAASVFARSARYNLDAVAADPCSSICFSPPRSAMSVSSGC